MLRKPLSPIYTSSVSKSVKFLFSPLVKKLNAKFAITGKRVELFPPI